jgi:aspartokinase
MKLSLMLLLTAALLSATPQEKKKEPFDPFADPVEELHNRAERNQKEKRFNELKAAAAELKELSARMSDEIEAGGKDVISAKLFTNLDRAEKLVKTIREKAK